MSVEPTDDDWRALDAARSSPDLAVAASSLGQDEAGFRRQLAQIAERLRMAASLPAASAGADQSGLQVPRLDPCPYCEILRGRYPERQGTSTST